MERLSFGEKILMSVLPKIVERSMQEVEKRDVMTEFMKKCAKNKLIRKGWKVWCRALFNLLTDWRHEVEDAMTWDVSD